MHAAALYPDRIEAVVLSDPCFAALRHLEHLGRWGHWQNFRDEAEQAGVTLSEEHWYDLGKFFDQFTTEQLAGDDQQLIHRRGSRFDVEGIRAFGAVGIDRYRVPLDPVMAGRQWLQ